METAERDSHRLDAFVDAAFAFAVTLLIVAGGEAPTSVEGLYAGLARVPAFAMGFGLITMFWLGHRSFGHLVPRRDNMVVVISLAIVFMSLVYVMPLQMLANTAAHYLSGGRLPGGEMIASLDDLRATFTIYGLGFAILSGLHVWLFRYGTLRAVALGVSTADRPRLAEWTQTWCVIATSGLLSAVLAQVVPQGLRYGLPGFAYWLIPVGIAVLDTRRRHQARSAPPDDT